MWRKEKCKSEKKWDRMRKAEKKVETTRCKNIMDLFSSLLFPLVLFFLNIYIVGTHGEHSLAHKSRKLLVNILLIVAKIFPDRYSQK